MERKQKGREGIYRKEMEKEFVGEKEKEKCQNVTIRDGEIRFLRFKSALNLVYLAAVPRS